MSESTVKRDEAQRRLLEILRRSGIRAEVDASEQDGRIVLVVSGDEVARVIGKKGAMLDALQYLVNKVVYRDMPADKPIVVDAEGYRERREETLIDLAQRLAEKAVRSKRPVPAEPMSAHDRRIVHMAIAELPGVTTRSEGEGAQRRVVVVPDPGKAGATAGSAESEE